MNSETPTWNKARSPTIYDPNNGPDNDAREVRCLVKAIRILGFIEQHPRHNLSGGCDEKLLPRMYVETYMMHSKELRKC